LQNAQLFFVFIIKLTKETRRRVRRGRDLRGGDRKGMDRWKREGVKRLFIVQSKPNIYSTVGTQRI
jgi:hypothetical protein